MSGKRYLPQGLVEGCKLRRAVPRDSVISYDDVEFPANRLADRLRLEQPAGSNALAALARNGSRH